MTKNNSPEEITAKKLSDENNSSNKAETVTEKDNILNKSENQDRKNNGSRNLVILGIIAVVVPLITTAISLYAYHQSGDIYLDRSRPGFLPDKKETEEKNEEKDYSFPDTGKITEKSLNEYIKNFNEDTNDLRKITSPYSDAPLTNESLGI